MLGMALRGRPRKQLMTIDEACHFLHLKSKQSIYNLLDRGMPYHRVGAGYQGGLRFDPGEVLAWLDEREAERRRQDDQAG